MFNTKKITAVIAAVCTIISAGASLIAGTFTTASAAEDYTVLYDETVKIINGIRAENGLSALKIFPAGCSVAEVRAEESSVQFSHTRPNGTECWTAVFEKEIPATRLGENLAYYSALNIEAMIGHLMDSPSHKANILGDFSHVGIGLYNKNGVYYMTQFFFKNDSYKGAYLPGTILKGDANKDGVVNPSDASTVISYYCDIQNGNDADVTADFSELADVNNDKIVDPADASAILAYYSLVSTGQAAHF